MLKPLKGFKRSPRLLAIQIDLREVVTQHQALDISAPLLSLESLRTHVREAQRHALRPLGLHFRDLTR